MPVAAAVCSSCYSSSEHQKTALRATISPFSLGFPGLHAPGAEGGSQISDTAAGKVQKHLQSDASGRCFSITLAAANQAGCSEDLPPASETACSQGGALCFWLPHRSLQDGRDDLDAFAEILSNPPSLAQRAQISEARLEAAEQWLSDHSPHAQGSSATDPLVQPHASKQLPNPTQVHGRDKVRPSHAVCLEPSSSRAPLHQPARAGPPATRDILQARQDRPNASKAGQLEDPFPQQQRLAQRVLHRQERVAARSSAGAHCMPGGQRGVPRGMISVRVGMRQGSNEEAMLSRPLQAAVKAARSLGSFGSLDTPVPGTAAPASKGRKALQVILGLSTNTMHPCKPWTCRHRVQQVL